MLSVSAQRVHSSNSLNQCELLFADLEASISSPPSHREIFEIAELVLDFMSQPSFERETKIFQMSMARIGHGKNSYGHTRWEHSLDVAFFAYRAARFRGFSHEDAAYAALVGAIHDREHVPGGHSLEIITRRDKDLFGIEFHHDDKGYLLISTDDSLKSWFKDKGVLTASGREIKLDYKKFVACFIPDEYIGNATHLTRINELEKFLYPDGNAPKTVFNLMNPDNIFELRDPTIRSPSRIAHDDADVTSYLQLDQKNSHFERSINHATFNGTLDVLQKYYMAQRSLDDNQSITDIRAIINFYSLFGRHYSLVTFNSGSLIAQGVFGEEAVTHSNKINFREVITGQSGDNEFFGPLEFPMLRTLIKSNDGASKFYPQRILLSFRGLQRHELRNIEECLTLAVNEWKGTHPASSALPSIMLFKRPAFDRGHPFKVKKIDDTASDVPTGSDSIYHKKGNTYEAYLRRENYLGDQSAPFETITVGTRLSDMWQIAVSDPAMTDKLLKTISELIEIYSDPRVTLKVVTAKDKRVA